jgi:hypothetical protein
MLPSSSNFSFSFLVQMPVERRVRWTLFKLPASRICSGDADRLLKATTTTMTTKKIKKNKTLFNMRLAFKKSSFFSHSSYPLRFFLFGFFFVFTCFF